MSDELNELDSLAAESESVEQVRTDFEPEPQPDTEAQKQAADAALAAASVAVSVIDGALQLAMPHIVVTDDQKATVTSKLAPVILKYQSGNGVVPSWVSSYQEELQLAASVGLVAFSIYQQQKMAAAGEALPVQQAQTQEAKEVEQNNGSQSESEAPKPSRHLLGKVWGG